VSAHDKHPGPATTIDLPELRPFAAAALQPHADHEEVELAGLDLSGQRADAAGFIRCRLARCRLDGLSMPRARLTECLVTECSGASVELAASVVRDTLWADCRFGVLAAADSGWTGVRVRGGKIDLLDLGTGRHANLAFEGCTIGQLDLTRSRVQTMRFDRCEIDELVIDGARLADVDLGGASVRVVRGIGALRGVTIAGEQLLDLAPQLAAHVGLTVRD
jgi:uncharacterized protein YjbI with pentapeptide repeats